RVKPNRRTGSKGNRAATDFFYETIKPWGYTIDATPFTCLDFESGEGSLVYNGNPFEIYISPYSLGCDVAAELVTVSTILELEKCYCTGKILLMKGEICAEQLMPKNFVFYNPEHHKRIYAILEERQPAAIITATARKPELVGALYPFPLIEDGDFNIPSVYCSDIVGEEIAANTDHEFHLVIQAKRVPSTACNVIARKNPDAREKIIVCAHIDVYSNTPGALDNASGTVVLLLLAKMLQKYDGPMAIEFIAFNGEDNFSVGGQMDYLRRYGNELKKVLVAINLDDVGYIKGKTAFSMYECPDIISKKAHQIFSSFNGIVRGEEWFQGDHMIFVQKGIPAIAFTAEKMRELMVKITHTQKDTPELVDCTKLVEIASALKEFIVDFV
ncbi:MAG: M28 family peptidase, partial [Candidatus Atribacteria bacterium]|nr:M28 family peptidase [Candidatus Atribacteria bacterium]